MAANERYRRTVDEVSSLLYHAKVQENDLKPITQVFSYAEENDSEENLKLLEIDENLLEILNDGDRLVFKGSRDDSAVLCTKRQTYEVKAAEISNSLALVPNILWPPDCGPSGNLPGNQRLLEEKQVLKIFYEYWEVRTCNPRLTKLHALLKQGLYCGPEYEREILEKDVKLYNFEDLLNCIQASEEELLCALKENFACCINGHWRLLNFDYHFRILSLVLGIVDENSWPLDGVVPEVVLQSLCDLVPEVILKHLLEWYTVATDKSTSEGERLHSLREDRICRFFGEVLLRPAGKFNYEDFLCAWQQSVPEGVKTDLKYLDGIAIKDLSNKPHVIYFFPEWDLPEDVQERFKILFKEREKWTLEEIRPYIERLASKKMNVNALLTKYARASSSGGVKWFSSRHGK